MDWLRRNWPDLLIGLALIAVIAGIVATLLTGGSFFPLGGNAPSQPAAPAPSVSAPSVPADPAPGSAAPDEGADADADAASTDAPSVAILPPTDPGSSDAAGDGSLAATPPGAPDPATVEDDAASSAPSVQPVAPDAPGSAAATPDAPSTPAADPAPVAPAPSAAPDPLPTEPYRVSVGAFGVRANADAQAERFRADGFPVFLASQEALTLVLVGPYERRADAEAAAQRIRQGDYDIDPVIYEFESDEAGAEAPASVPDAPDVPATPAAPAPAATPAEPASVSPPAAAPQEGVRLQVGAYSERASAAPQIERLEDLGFDVTVIDEDGLVKLVVGPFVGTALDDARIVLDGAGIESFAR